MHEALSGLTTRGRSFIAAAAAAGLSALVLGEKDLLHVSILLLVLPLFSAASAFRARYKVTCERVCEPHRIPAGSSSRVILRLRNLSRVRVGVMLLEDQLPSTLGAPPRFILEKLGAHQTSTVSYTVRTDARGRYEIGPLLVRITDPFGLCELTRSFPLTDTLTVIPKVVPLPTLAIPGAYAGTGEGQTRSLAIHGDDDSAPREYRHGDDLRRVHWRSTARVGKLMVRREEQPWESRATIIVDTRASAHRGTGPASSFEWLISAAASVSARLRHESYRIRMITDTGVDADDGDALLDHLAEVTPSQHTGVSRLLEHIRHGYDGGLVIAFLGLTSPAEAELLAQLRRTGTTYVAFLMDSTTWLPHSPDQRATAKRSHEIATLTLIRAGWRIIDVTHGANLAALWPQISHGNQGFALRAALAESISPRTPGEDS